MPSLLIPEPLQLIEVKPETLHAHWPFIKTGLEDICRRIACDWIPNDVYSALRMAACNCVVVQRSRPLGFGVYYRENRVFSGKCHLFVWAAWNLPPKERTAADNVPEGVAAGWRYLQVVAKTTFGTNVIRFITTPRRAAAFRRKYGFLSAFTTVDVEV
jgi:hypothetical protein